MTTPDDKTLDALISELRTYPGLYGDAGAKSADAIAALRERIAALEAERDALRKALVELIACDDAPRTSVQIGIHDYGCPSTRSARTVYGPCNCPGDEADGRIQMAWTAARAAIWRGNDRAYSHRPSGN